MVPGNRGAEEGEVKVNLFKKNPVWSKRGRAGTFVFAKKVHKKYTNIHPFYLQSASGKTKIPNYNIFSDTSHGRGSIGGTFTATVWLVPPV